MWRVSGGKQLYFAEDLSTSAKAKTLRMVWKFETIVGALGRKVLKFEESASFRKKFCSSILLLATYSYSVFSAGKCKTKHAKI